MLKARHYVGNGSFEWQTVGFAFDLPADAAGLSLELGNSGTGDVLFTDVEIQPLAAGGALTAGIAAAANSSSPKIDAAPAGALAEYRMQEAQGLYVYDYARGPFGTLELANLDWVTDEGRPALRFADNAAGKAVYPRAGIIDRVYFGTPGYAERHALPVATAGHHGGGIDLNGLTISSWIKPAAEMGKSQNAYGDIAGVGARRFILSVCGQQPPYSIGARVNVNDRFVADKVSLAADRWHHVALTAQPEGGQWRVKLYVDGQQVHEGRTEKFAAPASIPPSIVLGTELFYFHDAYYRGLIGHTLVLDRAATAEEIAALAKPSK